MSSIWTASQKSNFSNYLSPDPGSPARLQKPTKEKLKASTNSKAPRGTTTWEHNSSQAVRYLQPRSNLIQFDGCIR